jgi:hypothetical protein
MSKTLILPTSERAALQTELETFAPDVQEHFFALGIEEPVTPETFFLACYRFEGLAQKVDETSNLVGADGQTRKSKLNALYQKALKAISAAGSVADGLRNQPTSETQAPPVTETPVRAPKRNLLAYGLGVVAVLGIILFILKTRKK